MKQKLEQQSQYGSHQGSRQPQHKAASCRQFHISAADSPFYCRYQEKQRREVLYYMLGCAEKHTSNILFVVIKYIYKKPPKRIIPTKV